MTVAKDPATMSGLEQLRAAFSPESGWKGIGATMDFRMIELEEGRVVFGGTPDERVYNPIGTVHGGYAATLLDSALGCVIHSLLKPGQRYTTLELKVAYHRAMTKETGEVRAEGRIVHVGRRAGFAEGRITDAKGTVYATATSTLMIMEG